MHKRLYALLLGCVILLALSGCGAGEKDTEVLTKGREFDYWRTLYAEPFALNFIISPEHSFELASPTGGDGSYLDYSAQFYYYAYHMLLVRGGELEAVYSERENREGDPERYLEYHKLPKEEMREAIKAALRLTAAEVDYLPAPDHLIDQGGGFKMLPPDEYDSATGKLIYTGEVALEQVRIDNTTQPASATMVLRRVVSTQPEAAVSCLVKYEQSGEDWRLVSAHSQWEQNDLVKLSGGKGMNTLGGLSPTDAISRFRCSATTPDGILMLLHNQEIQGYDLVHLNEEGRILATGQLPDTLSGGSAPLINIYDDKLIICTAGAAFAGDLTLERFTKYELTYWSWGGDAQSAVMLPDLITWYYTGRDGIYQYNSDTGEHFPIATHPSPAREDDHGMSAQVYRNISLVDDGNRLVVSVVGYEWISDIHIFDLTPGSILTRSELELGWGYSGGGYAGSDYFVYHDVSAHGGHSDTATLTGSYSYRDGEHTALSQAAAAQIGSGEPGAIHASYTGDTLAVVTRRDDSQGGAYTIYRVQPKNGSVEVAATISAALPRLLGVFPDNSVLAVYNDYGHSGFIVG